MSSVLRKVINAKNAAQAIGPYSQAVIGGNTLYISGQLGLLADTGEMVKGGAAPEAEQALKNMGAILEAAGSSFDHVVKTTILLADINDWPKVNEVYSKFFTKDFPARAAYQVSALPKNGKVEIEAVALVGNLQK